MAGRLGEISWVHTDLHKLPKSNIGIIRLNAKFGFVVIGEVADHYDDPDEPAIVMELKL